MEEIFSEISIEGLVIYSVSLSLLVLKKLQVAKARVDKGRNYIGHSGGGRGGGTFEPLLSVIL